MPERVGANIRGSQEVAWYTAVIVFQPDIIVTSADFLDTALVVEVTLVDGSLDHGESQLMQYMFRMRCPVGLLVTPRVIRIYRDTFSEYDVSSIERVGEFSVSDVFDDERLPSSRTTRENTKRDAFRFESEVQAWLEHLSAGSGLADLPPKLREAFEEYVLPALATGEIRAAGPRWAHSA